METKKTLYPQAEKETKKLLSQLLKAQEKGDIDLFSSCFATSEELVNIGTDIDEYWVGWNTFFSYMKHMIELRKDLKILSRDTRIRISKNGDVAWFAQLIDTCIETKGDPFRLEGFRHTGVMEVIDGQWKIVQSHTSVALEHPDERMAN